MGRPGSQFGKPDRSTVRLPTFGETVLLRTLLHGYAGFAGAVQSDEFVDGRQFRRERPRAHADGRPDVGRESDNGQHGAIHLQPDHSREARSDVLQSAGCRYQFVYIGTGTLQPRSHRLLLVRQRYWRRGPTSLARTVSAW